MYEDFQRQLMITPSHVSNSNVMSNNKIISEFKTILMNLTVHPGNVEEYFESMVDLLKNVTDESVVRDVIEILFDQVLSPV